MTAIHVSVTTATSKNLFWSWKLSKKRGTYSDILSPLNLLIRMFILIMKFIVLIATLCLIFNKSTKSKGNINDI